MFCRTRATAAHKDLPVSRPVLSLNSFAFASRRILPLACSFGGVIHLSW